jgi:hypothetical protein
VEIISFGWALIGMATTSTQARIYATTVIAMIRNNQILIYNYGIMEPSRSSLLYTTVRILQFPVYIPYLLLGAQTIY